MGITQWRGVFPGGTHIGVTPAYMEPTWVSHNSEVDFWGGGSYRGGRHLQMGDSWALQNGVMDFWGGPILE